MLEDILNAVACSVLLLDEELRTVYLNRKAMEEFNIVCSEQYQGKRPGNVFPCLNSALDPKGCGYSPYCGDCLLRKTLLRAIDMQESTAGLEIGYGERWFLISVAPWEISGMKYLVLTSLEISGRKLLEDQLAKEKEKVEQTLSFLQEALKASNAGMDIVDREYNLLYVDPNWREIYGDFTDKKCYEYFKDKNVPCEACAVPRVLESKQRVVTEQMLPKEGNRVVQVNCIPYRLSDDDWVALEFKVDITEHKELEEKLSRANQELKKALRVAEEANKAKNLFLSKVSHEIRTPLNIIIGMTNILADDELKPEHKEYVQMVKESAESLLSIINDLLDLSRAESDTFTIERSLCNLADFIEKAVTPFIIQAGQKGIELSYVLDDEIPPVVFIDERRVKQVLNNLLSNAVKYTDRGKVDLTVYRVEKEEEHQKHSPFHHSAWLRFSVKDEGPGIPEDKLPLLFQPFAQISEPSRQQKEGTGLGLAVAKKLVEIMGGFIEVQTKWQEGSTFSFTIPVEVVSEDGITAGPTAVLSPEDIKETRILIVDDNKSNQLILQKILQQYGITRIGTSDDGPGAVAIVKEAQEKGEPYDIVLLDEIMIGMDGFETAEEIRRLFPPQRIGLIMISSGFDTYDYRCYKNMGICARLTKPVLPTNLYDAICRCILERRKSRECQAPRTPSSSGLEASGTKENKFLPLEILVVEDKLMNQKLVKVLLEKKGYKVTFAFNGEEALQLYQRQPFDLILMDILMPVMDGLEATKKIRSLEKGRGMKRTPILAMTAYAMGEEIKKCFEAGMDGCITKPINAEELYSVLENFCSRAIQETRDKEKDKAVTVMTPQERARAEVNQLLANLGKEALTILEIFLEDFRVEVDKLKSLINSRDLTSAVASIHGLKGEIGNLGLNQAFLLAQDAEYLLKEGKADESKDKLQELEEEIAVVAEVYERLMTASQ